MGSPVWGLRPMRALRCDFLRRPSPGSTKRPFFFASFTAVSVSVIKNAAAVLLLVPVFSARWRTNCVFVMPAAMNPPSATCLRVRSDAMLHQRFPQRKRFTAFLAGFLRLLYRKSVEILGFWGISLDRAIQPGVFNAATILQAPEET